jgi:hypothetical protein
LLGFAKFSLETLLFWSLFGDFIPKGENLEPKQVSVSKGGISKLCVNIGREDQNGGISKLCVNIGREDQKGE